MTSRFLFFPGGSLAALTLGCALAAQDPVAPEASQPPVAAPQAAPEAGAKTKTQWIQDLGSDSYRERLAAEQALRAMGQEALPALRKAAAEAKDSEVQWRARRLVRQIENGASGALQQRGKDAPAAPDTGPAVPGRRLPGGPGAGLPDGVRDQFEGLFRQMERDFGLDIPRGRFFADDFFQDLQDQLQSGAGRAQGLSMQIGPDGAVKVEVQQKNEKGEVETKVYEAPDLESFHEQYPGVLQQNGLGGGLQLWLGGNAMGPGGPGGLGLRRVLPQGQPMDPAPRGGRVLQRAQRGPGAAPAPDEPDAGSGALEPVPPPDGRRLGVFVRPEIPADVRQYLELEEGTGLMVESVQPGSLAATIGLQGGDIVVKVGSRTIGTTADVQEALAAIDVGQPVEVQFVRKGVAKSASAPKPAIEAGERKSAARRLEPAPSSRQDGKADGKGGSGR